MKKRNVINLIRYHAERNDTSFRNEAYEIARDFDKSGDGELASYIMALLSEAGTFTTQSFEPTTEYLSRVASPTEPLPLPDAIADDLKGIINAVSHDRGVSKFLFQGPPGSGKTESAKQVARLLARDLYWVDFSAVIDSKLGQTSKNIAALFKEINRFPNPSKITVLFDEIDAIILDRTSSNDVREMGRATSTFLRELDAVDPRVVIIATTNLFKGFDKAIVRRFDYVVDFARYDEENLREAAETLLNTNLERFKAKGRNKHLFRGILDQAAPLPYPGDMSNIIKTAIAFSDPSDDYDYLRRLYKALARNPVDTIRGLKDQGFTMGEIALLTGVSKSTVSRELKE
ncbi:AAA family ATPase [Gordonibacter urolithinfaciens]|uniref:AAA family ATPase n=1 Tax=Gordonibacter urolithinfaciens TaxID=1335613 RepID=UPI000B386BE7|nr:AAA family ATPase [Gordonibacter urolithinfaciens]OUO84024.1 AAA family ATPase [Gordonibacter urolithinfaciens]